VLEDRLPLHMPAKLYPVQANAYGLVRGALKALYSPTLKGRARGVLEALRAAELTGARLRARGRAPRPSLSSVLPPRESHETGRTAPLGGPGERR